MKKTLLLILAICLLVSGPGAMADELSLDGPVVMSDVMSGDLGDFVVGATSKLTGMFFTNMWGNNTVDIDVRQLIHGYSPVYWTTQAAFTRDFQVIFDIQTSVHDNGNKLYIVQIQEGLKYSDGSPITARDYAFSYMLGAAPQIAQIGGTATATSYISGYESYNSGASETFSGVRVFDDLTFAIEVDAKYLPFFYEIGYLDTNPYPISVIAPGCEVVDDGQGVYIRNIDNSVTEPIFTADLLRQTILDEETGYLSHPSVTSGPYRLASYDAASGIARFNINPYYKGNWKGKVPSIDNLVMKQVLPDQMIGELQSGTVQLLNKVVAADDIMEGMNLAVAEEAGMGNYNRVGLGFLSFNCDRGVFTSKAMRQAVGYLVDKSGFVYDYNQFFGNAVNGYYGVGQWMFRMVTGARDGINTDDSTVMEQWDGLTDAFNSLKQYSYDPAAAVQLLESDGWTLNETGDNFRPGIDTFRYKMVDGELTQLVVRWGMTEASAGAKKLEQWIAQPFADAGIRLEIDMVSYDELMDYYYRKLDYRYDMLMLASNFKSAFDPSTTFSTKEEDIGVSNNTGIRSESLERAALEMRATEPGDLYSYAEKWVEFQKEFLEELPLLPLYSNIYFDFHTTMLNDYTPYSEMSFPVALLSATYGYQETEPETSTDDFSADDGSSDGEWSTDDGILVF